MCIKTLPSTLVIQLKRFYYDWDAARSLKFDDYFQVTLKKNIIIIILPLFLRVHFRLLIGK